MAKTSRGVRGGGRGSRVRRTGPGFTEPVENETFAKSEAATSPALTVRYVAVDKLTGNEVSNELTTPDAVKKWITLAERDDRRDGAYEPDSYYIRAINVIKRRR